MMGTLIMLALCAGVCAQEAPPPAMTEYMGRSIAQTMSFHGADWLTRRTRQKEENTALMMKALGAKPGDVVCDLGCGNGYHTLRIAKAIAPGGWVYGSDIQPEMLTMLNDRADAAGVDNITPVLGTVVDPRLPANSCDLILLVDVYHEFDRPVHMLAAIRRALKPEGRLALVEFRAEDDSVPIKPLHKMSKVQIMKELTANGFKLAESFDKLPWQHMIFFQRNPGSDGPAPGNEESKTK
jgi:ubiquinone/menaquinone biosynthesis C-methylase UbiE